MVLHRRVQVHGDAGHVPHAERLTASLFQGIEDGAGLGGSRRNLLMQLRVMVAVTQRGRVRLSAHARHVLVGKIRGGLRQAQRVPVRWRRFRHELHVELRMMGNGAGGGGGLLAEDLQRRAPGIVLRLAALVHDFMDRGACPLCGVS